MAAPIAEYADAFYYEAVARAIVARAIVARAIVARAIVAGEGAETGALWNLHHLPAGLPHAADIHWMPLPSRWLVPFVAWALGGRTGAAVGLAGLVPWVGWALRNRALLGEDYGAYRAATATAVDILPVVQGVAVSGMALEARMAAIAESALPALWALVGDGVYVVPGLALWAGWQHRRERWVVATLAAWLMLPLVALVLAPGVAVNGTMQRTGAAFFPLLCALAGPAVLALGHLTARLRGYPVWLAPAALRLVFVAGTVGAGVRKIQRVEIHTANDCALLADAPPGSVVYTWKPMYAQRHCGRRAVVLPQGLEPERAAAIADRYGIPWALTAPVVRTDPIYARPEHAAAILESWEQIHPRVWRR